MQIRFTPNTYADIDAVYEYIASNNPTTAQNTLNQIESMIDYLLIHPKLGRQGRVENTRELLVANTPYIIVYELSSAFITILAIIHSRRRWVVIRNA